MRPTKKTQEAKSAYEEAIKAFREATNQKGTKNWIERQLLDSKKSIGRLERSRDKADDDIAQQKKLLQQKKEELKQGLSDLQSMEDSRQQLDKDIQKANQEYAQKAHELYMAETSQDAKTRHAKMVCALIGEEDPAKLPDELSGHLQMVIASFISLQDAHKQLAAKKKEAQQQADAAKEEPQRPPAKKVKGPEGEAREAPQAPPAEPSHTTPVATTAEQAQAPSPAPPAPTVPDPPTQTEADPAHDAEMCPLPDDISDVTTEATHRSRSPLRQPQPQCTNKHGVKPRQLARPQPKSKGGRGKGKKR